MTNNTTAALTDEHIDEIAYGHRNVAGGIYASNVYDFARAIERALLAAPRAASVPTTFNLLAKPHVGMRVDYTGMFGEAQRALGSRHPASAEMLRQFQEHLAELGRRWYAGDTAVVDELLQLYCVEKDARDALAAAPAAPVAEPVCATCNGNGMIGGPSFYAPDEGGVPCPECAQAVAADGAVHTDAGWRFGVEAVATMLDKKADDYADEFGSVDPDTGALEFGTGSHAEVKRDYHSSLIELADEVRAMTPARAAVSPATADERAAFAWPPLPPFPESFAHVAGHAYFTEHQMQGYANAYGKAVRASQAAAPAEAREPTMYQSRTRPTWDDKHPWTKWEECSKEAAVDYRRTPVLHGWAFEVRELFDVPVSGAVDAGEAVSLTAAARDVLAERARQVSAEGWTLDNDDLRRDQGELSYAAAGLARLASDAATDIVCGTTGGLTYADACIGDPDPWPAGWIYKPATPRRNLVKAAALAIAEIERIDRAEARTAGAQGGKGGDRG
ncbi:hypothetical protein [Burkholderia plantarii]|uniref:hypothetical protein n=1 Tax=Burkholderia plantarii TaxID=41899 RepID=UPI0008706E78|nr:hypothetical protein [Burkholderia plantarii]